MHVPIRRALALGLLALVLQPAPALAQAPDPESLVHSFVDGWNAHDAAALGKLFAEDLEWVTVQGNWEQGRAKIRQQMQKAHESYFKDSTLTARRTRVRLLRPDVALIHFDWEVAGRLDPQGRAREPRNGIITMIATRREDGWRIAAAQNTYASAED